MKNRNLKFTGSIVNHIIGILFIVILINTQIILGTSIKSSMTSENLLTDKNTTNEKFYFNPYVLEVKKNKGELLYYGSYHNVNIEHPQFKDIENKWDTFKPEVVYSEGSLWPLIRSKKRAIEMYGEQGLLRYLADRDKVKIKCIEPSKRSEMFYLLKKFSPTKIKIYYIIRQMIINKEIFNKNTDTEYIQSMLKYMTKIKFFEKSLKSMDEFSTMVRVLLPELKDLKKIDSKYFMNVLNKRNWLAKINNRVNKYRNKYMIKKIIKKVKRGKRVFAVVGRSHVLEQEKFLLAKIR